jgi:hypothetical protein
MRRSSNASMGKNTFTRRLFAAFSRYRPRVLTLAVLAAIGAVIVLANLSEGYSSRKSEKIPRTPADLEFEVGEEPVLGAYMNMSYGWPLRWRQYVIGSGWGFVNVIGECSSTGRLAGNLAFWLVMLAVPAGACEWLLRRYRPRFRFSLRTMLAATGLAAALCGWFVAARHRANVQQSLIDVIEERDGQVWVERWGPKWLDNVGADRYRRRIAGVSLNVRAADDEEERKGQQLIDDLKRLPDLRYFSLEASRLTPEMTAAVREMQRLEALEIVVFDFTADSSTEFGRALRGMRRLRTLSVGQHALSLVDAEARREFLAAIGDQPRLEQLRLERWEIGGQELALLRGLGNLKSLALHDMLPPLGRSGRDPPLLSHLPALPRLETLDLLDSSVCDRDLRYVAALPRLKSLNLDDTHVTGAGLAELAPLESLEELTVDLDAESLAGFESLLKLKRLKRLHVEFFDAESWQSPDALRRKVQLQIPVDEIEGSVRALEALRKSNPGLVVDGDVESDLWDDERMTPKGDVDPDRWMDAFAREAVQAWKEKQAGK